MSQRQVPPEGSANELESDPRVSRLTETVYVFQSYANASMVVTSEGVLAIDTPMSPRNSVPWASFIRRRGPLRFLVYTEHHPDHTAGGHYLDPEVIVASETTAAQMLEGAGSTQRIKGFLQTWARDPAVAPAALEQFRMRQPTLTFTERMALTLGGRRFVLFVGPGHTKGQAIVHAVDDRVAFIGDAADGQSDSPRWHSGDPWGHLVTLAFLEALDVDWYVSGHVPPFKRDGLAQTRKGILNFLDRLRAADGGGASFHQMLQDAALFEAQRRPGGDSRDVPPNVRQLMTYTRRRTLEEALEALRHRHPTQPPKSLLDPEPTDAELIAPTEPFPR